MRISDWSSDVCSSDLWLFGVPGALVLPLMLVLSRRMWGEYAMGGWQGQLGRCLLGIYLIGLALSLYQPDPLVALPAGWGGVLGLLTTKAILSLSANAPDPASMWISGSIMTIALITGIVIWYRSLALEKPLFHFEKPKLPRFSLPRRGLGDETAELRSAPVEAAPRPAVAPAERPPHNLQSPQPAAARPQSRDARPERTEERRVGQNSGSTVRSQGS